MKYQLKCLKTNSLIEDNYTLHYSDDALLQTKYQQMLSKNEHYGVWKYHPWLPVSGVSEFIAGSTTYKATKLGLELGLNNLWVCFHGYWPEKGGLCPTGSFKDMEAIPTIQRLRDHNGKGLICASAGNTARAFTHFCGLSDIPLIVIVGKDHAKRIWARSENQLDSVKIVVIKDGDYSDAKWVAKKLASRLDGWQLEGGVHNVARRDGIGTLIINAAEEMQRLPDHYFQGVGGGPGPIGVNEMAERLIESKLFDGPVPKQHLSQNIEHCPIHKAWQDKRSQLREDDFPSHDVEVYSDYLMNSAPAYGIIGGVYDILNKSNGETYAISEKEAIAAKNLFESIEGIDIMTPSAVSTASLIKAIEIGNVQKDDYTLLNISGGGVARLFAEQEIKETEPWIIVNRDVAVESIIEKL